jgi:hypothetical protein
MKTQLKTALHYCIAAAIGLLLATLPRQLSAAGETDSTGLYSLVSVDGKTVPASIAHEGVTIQIRSGSFTINADGTCASKMVFSVQSGPEATREVSATYTQEGSKLTMQWKGAGKTTGTLDSETFTMNNEGMVLVYRK